MNKEQGNRLLKSPFDRILSGINKKLTQSIVIAAVNGSAGILGVERAIRNEYDQAFGVLIIPSVLAVVALYHWYREGEKE